MEVTSGAGIHVLEPKRAWGATPRAATWQWSPRSELVSAESYWQKVRREWCAGIPLSAVDVMVLLLRTTMEKRGMRKASCVLLQLALSAAVAHVPAAAIFSDTLYCWTE